MASGNKSRQVEIFF